MKTFTASLFLAAVDASHSEQTNPVAKVLDLISDLQQKIIGEGTASQKVYDEFAEWCEDSSKSLDFQIKTGQAQSDALNALLGEEAARIDSLYARIEELAHAMAKDDADLTAATEIRTAEAGDFAAEEAELTDIISTLERAVGILEREMQKSGGASMLQNANAGSIVDALTTMVEASMLSSADVKKLSSLVQSAQESADEDSDDAPGSPAAAMYASHSGNIVDVLSSLLEKAEARLDGARKQETSALYNFGMLKQSLLDQIRFSKKDTAAAKKSLAESQESKATATGDLAVTSKDLAEDFKVRSTLHSDCMMKAQTFELETTSRAEELKSLATAKKVLAASSSGAVRQSYGLDQTSLLQLGRSKLSSRTDLAKYEAVRLVRDMAIKQESKALAQLASRMETAMRSQDGSGEDPFAKVKGLISDMLERLEGEAAADATHQAWCVKQMAESHEKKQDLENTHAKLSTKIDQMNARSTNLKREVAALQSALAGLAKSQQEMNALRASEKGIYEHDRPEMEQGIEGIKLALKILRDYYGSEDFDHVAAEGASEGVIGLMQVIESDFSKGLAEMIAEEESAAAVYDRQSKENAVEKVTKDQSVRYKSKESVRLDKAVSQANSDRSGTQEELDAIVEYLKQLDEACIVQPDTYALRKSRREAELAGLKEALEILEGEGPIALLQGSRHRLRVIRGHGQA